MAESPPSLSVKHSEKWDASPPSLDVKHFIRWEGAPPTLAVQHNETWENQGFVFEEGTLLATEGGQQSLAFIRGDDISASGSSNLTFIEGTGVDFQN